MSSTRATASSNAAITRRRNPPHQPDPEPYEEEDILSDEDLEDEEDDLDFIDPSMLLQSLLSTEDGSDTICTALVKIHSQLEVHNKIMVKLLSHLTTAAKKVAEEKAS